MNISINDCKIDVDRILSSNIGINALGEFLRELFFDQSKGLGCYQSFDVNNDVEELENETDNENGIVWKCYKFAGVIMKYYWDGDGFLKFELPNQKSLVNDDCKKDYNWKLEDYNE